MIVSDRPGNRPPDPSPPLPRPAVSACSENGTVKFLTKGDNNSVDDRGLYAPGQLWLTKRDVVGRARGFVPYIGVVTILMNDYPKLKVSRRSGVSEGVVRRVSVLWGGRVLWLVCGGWWMISVWLQRCF